jgi:hypothetical protein
MTVRAVRAVNGIVETGYVTHLLHVNNKWRPLHNVYLPPEGPLTDGNAAALARMKRTLSPEYYWFASHDTRDGQWRPMFSCRGVTMSLRISFYNQEECERFILDRIMRASDEIGDPRVKVYPDFTYPYTSRIGYDAAGQHFPDQDGYGYGESSVFG